MTIKEYLEENKMTYKVLAELVGCSQGDDYECCQVWERIKKAIRHR